MEEIIELLREAAKDIKTINAVHPVDAVFRSRAIDRVEEAIARLETELRAANQGYTNEQS